MSQLIVKLDHKHFMGESTYVVFIEDDTVYALNNRTKTIQKGTNANEVIQEVLNSLGS